MRRSRPATKSNPRSPQLEKAHVQQQRPSAARNKNKLVNNKFLKYIKKKNNKTHKHKKFEYQKHKEIPSWTNAKQNPVNWFTTGRVQKFPSATRYPSQMNKLAFPLKEKALTERRKPSRLYMV